MRAIGVLHIDEHHRCRPAHRRRPGCHPVDARVQSTSLGIAYSIFLVIQWTHAYVDPGGPRYMLPGSIAFVMLFAVFVVHPTRRGCIRALVQIRDGRIVELSVESATASAHRPSKTKRLLSKKFAMSPASDPAPTPMIGHVETNSEALTSTA